MKSRAFVTWVALSLVIHGVLLAVLCGSENSRPRQKQPSKINLVYLCFPAPKLIAPVNADRSDSRNSTRFSSKARIAPVAAPRPLKPSPIKTLPILAQVVESTTKSDSPQGETSARETARVYPEQPSPEKSATTLAGSTPNQFSGSASNPINSVVQSGETTSRPASVAGSTQTDVATQPPRYFMNPPPAYPAMALKRHWQGEVRLRALVGEQGEVIDVWVEDSSGHAVLDDTALDTVRRWKFHPACNGDKNIQQEVRLPIRFELARS